MEWLGVLCVEVQGMTFTSIVPCSSRHMVEAFAKSKPKGTAEDFFLYYKAKKHFFSSTFSSSVLVLRWTQMRCTDGKVFQEGLIHGFCAVLCTREVPAGPRIHTVGGTWGGGSVPPGFHTANIVVMRHVLVLGLFCNREYFPAQKWNTIWRSNSLEWVKF